MTVTMGERLVKIETDLSYLKVQADKTVEKLDMFIDSADQKYATKEELSVLNSRVLDNTSDIRYLILKWGPLIGVLALIAVDLVRG
jgi:hypothetical protein